MVYKENILHHQNGHYKITGRMKEKEICIWSYVQQRTDKITARAALLLQPKPFAKDICHFTFFDLSLLATMQPFSTTSFF